MTTIVQDPQHPTPVRVLVAEDSPLNLQIALKQLEKLGFAADGVPDGNKALEALQKTDYDIILMDCQMPELNGYEATWQIRDRERERARDTEGKSKRIYIIAMTANSKSDNRERCREAGMDDYIQKPVGMGELEAALHRGLADRASQKAIEEVIDPVVIAGLRQLRMPEKADPLIEVIDLFNHEAPAQIEAMAAAVAQNDASSLSRLFQATASLNGGASNLGARSLAALCEEIEQTARNWSLSDVPPLIDRAREELIRVQKALELIKRTDTPGVTAPRG